MKQRERESSIKGFQADTARFKSFFSHVLAHTHLLQLTVILIVLWLVFSAAFFFAEHGAQGAAVRSYGEALYWGVTAFTTAGLGSTPVTALGQVIGGIWIILGSILFLGTMVGTVTAYFMRPLETPARQIVETIQDNLEKLDELSVEELQLLKATVDGLIKHMEKTKMRDENNHSEA